MFLPAIMLLLPLTGLAQNASYSMQSKLLVIPHVVVDDSLVYGNVVMNLDLQTGQFSILSAAKADPSDTQVQQLDLGYGQSLALDDNTMLTFTQVQSDSRCPSDTLCVAAGVVTALFQLNESDSGAVYVFGLRLEAGADITGHEINGRHFRLRQVEPYPVSTSTIDPEDYMVMLDYSLLPLD